MKFYKQLYARMDALEMDRSFTSRSVNEGFSGGEKKRNEILQLMMLEPKYAILDETDSGLDIDALKIVSRGVNAMRSENRGFLVITHYQRLLNYIQPDIVHVLMDGRIVKTGGKELSLELERRLAGGREGRAAQDLAANMGLVPVMGHLAPDDAVQPGAQRVARLSPRVGAVPACSDGFPGAEEHRLEEIFSIARGNVEGAEQEGDERPLGPEDLDRG